MTALPFFRKEPRRLFCLLIGINDYTSTSFHSLRGAEADAQEWNDFLVQDLGVPNSDSTITMLLGRSATRKNIIAAFERLINNDHIEEGDPILIFYAGHGSQVERGILDGGQKIIQAVIPADFDEGEGKDPVYCITDLEVGALIDRIADKRGNNITVIMDCCYAASGTRGSSESERLVRSGTIILPSVYLDPDIDRKMGRGPERVSYSRAGLRSHMLLAACTSTEMAHESNGHGEFTRALLHLLRSVQSIDKLRYDDILLKMDRIRGQNPQCVGANTDRFLFDGKMSRPLPKHYKVNFIAANEDLILKAGSVHGVKTGAKFNIYAEGDTSFTDIIGVATVKDVTASSATMTYSPSLALKELCPYYALQVKPEKPDDFSLFIPRGDTFRALFDEVGGDDLISTVDDENSTPESYMQVSMGETHKVTFELKGRRLAQYGFKKQFAPINGNNLDEVERVLKGIAHYYRELNRKSPESGPQNVIDIEFYRLGPIAPGDPWQKFVPKGPSYFQGGVIDFEVLEGAPYGVKLINKSNRDLYPYLFYFNNDDLSIVSIHDTSANYTGYSIEAPLKKKGDDSDGILTLGYGSSGVPPWMYTMGQESRLVDFLKIIFTTQPIDISSICSPAYPFKGTRGGKAWNRRTSGWFSICVPVILRSPGT